MDFAQLEKTRDQVCAELTSDSIKDSKKLIEAIIEIPIRDGLLRYLYDNPHARKSVSANIENLLKQDLPQAKAVLATVLAGCYWLDADFAATRTALDQALASDSTYSLARLLDVALTHGVPASVWADSLAAVSPKQCLTGAA